MNERISELINQAARQYEQEVGSETPKVYYDRAMEIFAELIVRECAGIYSKIDNGNLHMGTDDYLEALHKTFFGVEQ
jgi:hypothetical protein